jgi:hypothetical protein
MREYSTTFGESGRLRARLEAGMYRWSLNLGRWNVDDYVSPTIPDVRTILKYFINRTPSKIRGSSRTEFSILKGKIKESIRCLEKASSEHN